MLCVLGIHAGDKAQAIRLLNWLKELGGAKTHRLLMVIALNTDESGVAELALELFEKVDVVRPNEDINGWPQGANSLWDTALRAIHRHPEPWLWLEPDCVFLSEGCIDSIEEESKSCAKPFMGDDVNVQGVRRHMSGVAVYPGMAMNYTSKLWQLGNEAWDVFLADDFIPYAHFCKTIQHVFWTSRSPDIEPTFPNRASLSILRPGAVLFHRCKDGSLIDRLREIRDEKRQALAVNLKVNAGMFAHDTRCMIEGIPEPLSITDQIRAHVSALEKIIDGKPGRQMQAVEELRKRKLIPKAKKHKS